MNSFAPFVAFLALSARHGGALLAVGVFRGLLVPLTAPPMVHARIGIDLALSLPAFMARLGLVVGGRGVEWAR